MASKKREKPTRSQRGKPGCLIQRGWRGAERRGGSAAAEWGAALPVTAAPRGVPRTARGGG